MLVFIEAGNLCVVCGPPSSNTLQTMCTTLRHSTQCTKHARICRLSIGYTNRAQFARAVGRTKKNKQKHFTQCPLCTCSMFVQINMSIEYLFSAPLKYFHARARANNPSASPFSCYRTRNLSGGIMMSSGVFACVCCTTCSRAKQSDTVVERAKS